MAAGIRLTWEEAEVLHRLAGSVLVSGQAGSDAPALRSVSRKLEQLAAKLSCKHCRRRPSRRRNGLCDACNTYEARFGRLPSEETLLKRRTRVGVPCR